MRDTLVEAPPIAEPHDGCPRLDALERDPAVRSARRRAADAGSEAELRRLWGSWRRATLAVLLRGRGAADEGGRPRPEAQATSSGTVCAKRPAIR